MNIQFHYKHINEVIKPDLEKYVQAKLKDLMRYVPEAPEGSVKATVSIEHFEKHDAYKVDMHITISSGKQKGFQAEETKHTYTESIDAVRDKLQMQMVKTKKKAATVAKPKGKATAKVAKKKAAPKKKAA